MLLHNTTITVKEGEIILPACGIIFVVTVGGLVLLKENNESYSLPNILIDNSFRFKESAYKALTDQISKDFYFLASNNELDMFSTRSSVSINGKFIDVMWDVYKISCTKDTPNIKLAKGYEFIDEASFLHGEVDTSMEQINLLYNIKQAQIPF